MIQLNISNSCDLGMNLYSNGFIQRVWFDTELTKPAFEQEIDIKNNVTYWRKVAKFRQFDTGLIPEYMVDLINMLPLLDQCEIVEDGVSIPIVEPEITTEWPEACYGRCIVRFKDTTVVGDQCCMNETITSSFLVEDDYLKLLVSGSGTGNIISLAVTTNAGFPVDMYVDWGDGTTSQSINDTSQTFGKTYTSGTTPQYTIRVWFTSVGGSVMKLNELQSLQISSTGAGNTLVYHGFAFPPNLAKLLFIYINTQVNIPITNFRLNTGWTLFGELRIQSTGVSSDITTLTFYDATKLKSLQCKGAKLNDINSILIFINNNGLSSGTINLTGGTSFPSSSLSPEGLAAYNALIARSYTVTLN